MSTTRVETINDFGQFNIGQALRRAVDAAGYTEPRPIQAQTIPSVLAGRDVLGLAQTGTGKTAAFALPVLERLLAAGSRRGPRVLVVAPTRELALQIDVEFRALAKFTKLKTVTIYGGVSERRQVQEIRQHPDIVVACPGRLLDLTRQGTLRLDRIETLVLDEADHMFDMGFLPDIRRILAALPEKRQNLLFAATMPAEIRGLASEILDDPVVVELAHSKPAETIEHALYPVLEKRKLDMLQHFLDGDGFASAIVFTRTKHRARRLAQQLAKAGHRAVALQGNMSQGQRDRAMEGFRRRRFDILVATDIVARGIDVDQVSHVINFDIPGTPEAYTHRIGRTGRSERSGKAYTFVTEDDGRMVHTIERQIGASIPLVRVDGFEDVVLRSSAGPTRSGGRSNGGGPRSPGKRTSSGRPSRRARPAGRASGAAGRSSGRPSERPSRPAGRTGGSGDGAPPENRKGRGKRRRRRRAGQSKGASAS